MSEQPPAAPDAGGRCPSCGARVVPSQDWCSLCLQPLAEQRRRSPVEGTHAAADGTGPTDPSHPTDPTDPTDPYAGAAGAGAAAPSAPLPPGAAEAMLAELAATSAADRPLGRGPLSGTSRPVRTALGCGAGVVLLGVLLTVLWLVGLLL